MIITVDDIRKYRQVAANISADRVDVYIKETERLDILPVIGADEYLRLISSGIDLNDDEKLLLDGGEWVDACGTKHLLSGLKAAEAYLAYSRFIRDHLTQVTPYGVVVKEGDYSQPASVQAVAAKAQEAQKIGRQYLNDCADYWRKVTDGKEGDRRKSTRLHILSIGD